MSFHHFIYEPNNVYELWRIEIRSGIATIVNNVYKGEVMDFYSLIENGVLNNYRFAEVIQIILLKKDDDVYWNYFTHIAFSSNLIKQKEREFLTSCPKSINLNYKVIITKETIATGDIINILQNAAEKQVWEWKEDKALLDNVFPIAPQFIPETDPTGNKTSDSTLVPIELALYGSNYAGGYYLCELFSVKTNLSKILSVKDIKSIQKEMNNVKLGFDLENLSDRIGNLVCKIPMRLVKHKLTRVTPDCGIEGQFVLNDEGQDSIACVLQIILENDNTIIESRIESIILSKDSPVKKYNIEPNRYKNTIILSDEKKGIIYYSAIRDYSFGSNYYSVITPPRYGIRASFKKRCIVIDGVSQEIELTDIVGIGEVSIEKEIYEMEKRQHKWTTKYEYDHYFFRSFVAGQEKEAIQTVIGICNDKDLFWDLKEIWLVDPYLSADDILKTVVYCGKYGISIKCLTHIASINGNTATRTNDNGNERRFDATVAKFNQILNDAIFNKSDIKIEFRTVTGMNGIPFHDRYLILKYDMNKSRAWSLGISINSLGKSHHIIQIVQSPMEVIKIIDAMWKQSNSEDCLIYKN